MGTVMDYNVAQRCDGARITIKAEKDGDKSCPSLLLCLEVKIIDGMKKRSPIFTVDGPKMTIFRSKNLQKTISPTYQPFSQL
jgi:hypothetical protein